MNECAGAPSHEFCRSSYFHHTLHQTTSPVDSSTKVDKDCGFGPAPPFASGSPKDTRPPARVCTFADTACAARFFSTSCASSITSYFPATCSSGSWEGSFRPLRWGLDVSGILQSRQEHRCNPHTSPPPAFAKFAASSRIRQRWHLAGAFLPQSHHSVGYNSFRRPTHIDAATWPLRCSPIVVLVSSKRQRSAFLDAKRSSAPPASASALIGCLGYFWEMPQ